MQLHHSFVSAKADSLMYFGCKIGDWKICRHIPSDCIYKSHTIVRHFSILSSYLWPRLPLRGLLPVVVLAKMLYAHQFSVVHAYCVSPSPSPPHHTLWSRHTNNSGCRSQLSRFLRLRSAAAWLLGSRVWIPLKACLFVSCVFLCVV